jgi:hypothetical protein
MGKTATQLQNCNKTATFATSPRSRHHARRGAYLRKISPRKPPVEKPIMYQMEPPQGKNNSTPGVLTP